MSDWTDELRAEVIEKYTKAKPTPENSVEIVQEIAEEIDKTPNGVRMILTKAGVYLKKETTSGGTSKTPNTGGTRTSKADSMAALTKAIEALGLEPDKAIIEKLTGKAALYFADVIGSLKDSDE